MDDNSGSLPNKSNDDMSGSPPDKKMRVSSPDKVDSVSEKTSAPNEEVSSTAENSGAAPAKEDDEAYDEEEEDDEYYDEEEEESDEASSGEEAEFSCDDSSPGYFDLKEDYGSQGAKLRECRLCRLQFHFIRQIPRLLSCGHTFCEQCLGMILEQDNGSQVTCPLDRKIMKNVTDISLLQKNKTLLDDMKRFGYEKKPYLWLPSVPCSQDASHTSKYYCKTCPADFCKECFTKTHESDAMKQHEKLPIDEKPYEFRKCSTHPDEILNYICSEELQKSEPDLACHLCLPTHMDHEHTNVDEKVYENKKKLEQLQKIIRFEVGMLKAQQSVCFNLLEEYDACPFDRKSSDDIRDPGPLVAYRLGREKKSEIKRLFKGKAYEALYALGELLRHTRILMKTACQANYYREGNSKRAYKEVERRLRTRTDWEFVGGFLTTRRSPVYTDYVPFLEDITFVVPKKTKFEMIDYSNVGDFWKSVQYDENGKALLKLFYDDDDDDDDTSNVPTV